MRLRVCTVMFGAGEILRRRHSYRSESSALVCEEQLGWVGYFLHFERVKAVRLTSAITGKHTDTRREHLPDAPAVLCLQGKLWQAHGDTNKAIECYAESLKLNPFMWDAFIALCDLGAFDLALI